MEETEDRPPTREEYRSIVANAVLPEWIDFPEVEKPVVYLYKGEDERVHIDGLTIDFADIPAACEYVEVSLDSLANFERIESRGMVSVPLENGYRRMFLSHRGNAQATIVAYTYHSFQKLHEKYLSDPTDFPTVYYWLKTHPAFYHRNAEHMNSWITDDGLDGMEQSVRRSEDGSTIVELEHGAPSEPDRVGRMRYADYRLDVTATTLEEAYILLAEKVNTYFNPDGIDTNDEGIKPDWLISVEKRLGDYHPRQD